jgi:hypothetical protein
MTALTRGRHASLQLAWSIILCSLAAIAAADDWSTITSSQTFSDPNLTQRSDFGTDVAINGNNLAIAMANGIAPGQAKHAVSIYDANSGQLRRTLTVPHQTNNGNYDFGISVALAGNLAVIGASYEHVTPPGGTTAYNSGAAYVFNIQTGQQIARLVPQDPTEGGKFGASVAIDGDMAVVGGWGAAYLFNPLTGQQIAKLTPSSVTQQFGISVALNNDFIVVGSNSDESRGTFTGAAYVFDRTTHAQHRKIVPDDALGGSFFPTYTDGDNFGISIALDGNNAVIGSPLHSRSNGNGGAAYVFDLSTGAQQAKLIPPSPDLNYPELFGGNVDIRGNLAVIGAPGDQRRNNAGAAFLYDWTSQTLLYELLPNNVRVEGALGSGVAFGSNFVVVVAQGMVPMTNGVPFNANQIAGSMGAVPGTAYRFELPVPEPSTCALFIYAFALTSISRHRRATDLT